MVLPEQHKDTFYSSVNSGKKRHKNETEAVSIDQNTYHELSYKVKLFVIQNT